MSMGKLRLRELRWLAQGHTARGQQIGLEAPFANDGAQVLGSWKADHARRCHPARVG